MGLSFSCSTFSISLREGFSLVPGIGVYLEFGACLILYLHSWSLGGGGFLGLHCHCLALLRSPLAPASLFFLAPPTASVSLLPVSPGITNLGGSLTWWSYNEQFPCKKMEIAIISLYLELRIRTFTHFLFFFFFSKKTQKTKKPTIYRYIKNPDLAFEISILRGCGHPSDCSQSPPEADDSWATLL